MSWTIDFSWLNSINGFAVGTSQCFSASTLARWTLLVSGWKTSGEPASSIVPRCDYPIIEFGIPWVSIYSDSYRSTCLLGCLKLMDIGLDIGDN